MPLKNPVGHHDLVAVFGLGEAGRAAVGLLHDLGATISAHDQRTTIPDPPLAAGVRLHLGDQDPGAASLAVLSPGLNPEWPENRSNPALGALWAAARAGRVELRSEIELAAAAHPAPLTTVGGTDGKSTTAALLAHLLRAFGVDAALGGNSWRALSQVVREQPDAHLLVAEVSAFQLWEPHALHPRVAVMTNIEPDHLDHYGAVEAYVAAKRHILRNLGPGDAFVYYAADPRLRAFADEARARGATLAAFGPGAAAVGADASGEVVGDELALAVPTGTLRVPLAALRIPGAHNQRNALAALLAVLLAPVAAPALANHDVAPARIAQALASFQGLPHRVALVRERAGVRWYNDSKATNVHAAVTGLRAFQEPLVAIVGGVDKGLALDGLLEVLAQRARATVVIGAIRQRLVEEAAGRLRGLAQAETLQEAVLLAAGAAQPGDAVVLAPACSSFDMFRGFEHRGEVFEALVRALPER